MKEEKSFWRKLNAWINGEEALIHADEYIARREQPKKRQWLKRPNMQEIKSNIDLHCVHHHHAAGGIQSANIWRSHGPCQQ